MVGIPRSLPGRNVQYDWERCHQNIQKTLTTDSDSSLDVTRTSMILLSIRFPPMNINMTTHEATKAMDWLQKHAPEFVEEYVKAVVECLKKQTIITDLQMSLNDEFGNLFDNISDQVVDNADEDTRSMLTTKIIKISEINKHIQAAKA